MTKSKIKPLQVNIHDAKTHFSRYLTKVQQGGEVVICKNGEPIAQVIPFKRTGEKDRNKLWGIASGMGSIPPSFFDELTEDDLPGMGL